MMRSRTNDLFFATFELAVLGGSMIAAAVIVADVVRLSYLLLSDIVLTKFIVGNVFVQGCAAVVGYGLTIAVLFRIRRAGRTSASLKRLQGLKRPDAVRAVILATGMMPFVAVTLWCAFVLMLVAVIALSGSIT